MNVSLYCISKNNEKNIKNFIKNAKKFDEVIVVDVGSTDKTVALLKDAGITVYEHPQKEEDFDFSVAKNQALSYVTNEWCLNLDLDTKIEKYNLDFFEKISENTTAVNITIESNISDGESETEEIIGFHLKDNYKWINAVYETLAFVPTSSFLKENVENSNFKVKKTIQKNKDLEEFYLSICEREHKKYPNNPHYVWNIFNNCLLNQDLKVALEFGQGFLNITESYSNARRVFIFIECSKILFNLGNVSKSANYAFHALSESMNIGEPYLSQAFSYLAELSKKLNNPNITIFATAFNPQTLSLPERHAAIDNLFLTNLDDIPSSCWTGHRRFAEWLVSYVSPEVIVDLGVDWGFSTFAFGMPRIGHVYGVDTFEGDDFTGKTGGQNYDYVLSKREKLFMEDNITFIRGLFDDVAKTWDKKIDILHIDGDHKYESIKNDYETWSKFLSDDGVILLHDTCVENIRGNEYGVKRFFEEIDLPKINFTHTFGLGVISKNKQLLDFIEKNIPLDKPL